MLVSRFWTTQRHEFLNDLLGTGKKPYYRERIYRMAVGLRLKNENFLENHIINIYRVITKLMRYPSRLQSEIECISDSFAIWNQAVRLQSFNTCFSDCCQNNEGPLQIGKTYQQALEELENSGLLKLSILPIRTDLNHPMKTFIPNSA